MPADNPPRRLLLLRLSGMGLALAGAAPDTTAQASPVAGVGAPGRPEALRRPVVTDHDPSDEAGWGRGRPAYRQVTDSDPHDGAGQGTGRAYTSGRFVTDIDPVDTRGIRSPPYRLRRWVTDTDPYDSVGQGRGWR